MPVRAEDREREDLDPLAAFAREISSCRLCPLADTRTNVVFGVGNPEADLVFVGEAPGRDEDLQGEPFVGRSGRLLDKLLLEETGLTRADVWIMNTLCCRPPGNRDPKPDEIAACSPRFERTLEIIDPKVIVTLGNFATRQVLGRTEGITKLRGQVHEVGGRRVVPTYHPAAALRSGGEVIAQMRADLIRAKQTLATVVPS